MYAFQLLSRKFALSVLLKYNARLSDIVVSQNRTLKIWNVNLILYAAESYLSFLNNV